MDIIISLGWAAFLGLLGQSLRSVDGLNKMYQQDKLGDFKPGFLILSLITGAIVGMAVSLGHFVGWTDSATYFLAGYAGTDFIEKRAQKLS